MIHVEYDGLTLAEALGTGRELIQPVENNVKARASGRITPGTPLRVTVPAFLVPHPYDSAVGHIEDRFRALISRPSEFDVLVNQVYATSFRGRYAAPLVPQPGVAGKGHDDRMDGFIGALNNPLDQAHDQLDQVLPAGGYLEAVSGTLNPKRRRVLGQISARSSRPQTPSDPGPGLPATPGREGGEA